MKNLLALLDRGTPGTSVQNSIVPRGNSEKAYLRPHVTPAGTQGTRGTLNTEPIRRHVTLAHCIADLTDTYRERVAICLEAGDIRQDEVESTAALEVGRLFVHQVIGDCSDEEHQRD